MISLCCPLNILLLTGHVSETKTDVTQIASNMLIHFDLQLKNCQHNGIKHVQRDRFFQVPPPLPSRGMHQSNLLITY